MNKLEVFDPSMCCKTGICGSSVDPKLVIFASDLEWLKVQGITVVRHGLSLEPVEFANNEIVKNLIQKEGNKCLPIILFENKWVLKSVYPSRKELASLCKVKFNEEEAPAVHREENCCCGVDCDCGSSRMPSSVSQDHAKPEGNCSCELERVQLKQSQGSPIRLILLMIVLLIVVGVIVKLFMTG